MNVLMISTDRGIFTEGAQVRERMRAYGTLAVELHIIVFTKKQLGLAPQQIAPNVRVYPTNSRSRWSYIRDTVRIGKKIAKEHTINLVITQDPFEAGLAGLRIARAGGVRLQVQIHTDFLNPFFTRQSFLNRIRVHIARRMLSQAHCIRVVSGRIKASLAHAFPNIADRIAILPIFVDIERIRASTPAFSLKEKFPQFDGHILCVSRLEPEKNLTLALAAFSEVHAHYPKVGLVIVGEGSARAALAARARSLGIASAVIFEGAQNDVYSYYKTADLLLLTSNYEGYGMTLIEAAAADCPVVTTDVGIARELLQNSEHEFMCPVGDSACLAREMMRLFENPTLRKVAVLKTQAVLQHIAIVDKNVYLKQYGNLWEQCTRT